MREAYVKELDSLQDSLIALGNAVTESLHKAIKAYTEKDRELAHELFSDDLRINAATADIERDAYRIIALQQPVAEDLRRIFSALHISRDLERIGDHAVSISRATIRVKAEYEDLPIVTEKIKKMADIAQQMIIKGLEVYVHKDAAAAKQIAAEDQLIDMLLKDIYTETAHFMKENPEVVSTGINGIGVANNIERIGDYVTNICENVVYINTGDLIELN